jgi:hypothetical protein
MLETMLLKTLPTIGPSKSRIAITTIATNTRINAYSTKPCPSSRGRYNIKAHLLSFSLNLETVVLQPNKLWALTGVILTILYTNIENAAIVREYQKCGFCVVFTPQLRVLSL